jgi:CRP-like cAMP-binding protein
LAAITHKRFKASEVIIRAESPALRLFIGRTGSVNFYIVTEKRQKILVRRFLSGDVFGIAVLKSERVLIIEGAIQYGGRLNVSPSLSSA